MQDVQQAALYPVNALRNRALQLVKTEVRTLVIINIIIITANMLASFEYLARCIQRQSIASKQNCPEANLKQSKFNSLTWHATVFKLSL